MSWRYAGTATGRTTSRKKCALPEGRVTVHSGHMSYLKFIVHRLDGEQMAALRREFGVSRKTGGKTLTRYSAKGLEGLN